MKLLLNEKLSPRPVSALQDLYPGTTHLESVGLDGAADLAICDYAGTNGAVIRPSAATAKLLQHRGKALVFETIEELHERINDESLDIDENSVMVLKNCGPKG